MAPDKPTYVTIHFEKGKPTALDGEELDRLQSSKSSISSAARTAWASWISSRTAWSA